MLRDEIIKMSEKIKKNVAIRKAFKEGKVRKYDDVFLEELTHYDYGRFPLLAYVLCPELFESNHYEIVVILASLLLSKGQVNLLKQTKSGYPVLELIDGNKKYVYDLAKKLVFTEIYYFVINPGINYEKTMFINDGTYDFLYNKMLVQVIDSDDARNELIASMLSDYKNNIDISAKTIVAYEKLNAKTKQARKFKREKIFYFD